MCELALEVRFTATVLAAVIYTLGIECGASLAWLISCALQTLSATPSNSRGPTYLSLSSLTFLARIGYPLTPSILRLVLALAIMRPGGNGGRLATRAERGSNVGGGTFGGAITTDAVNTAFARSVTPGGEVFGI